MKRTKSEAREETRNRVQLTQAWASSVLGHEVGHVVDHLAPMAYFPLKFLPPGTPAGRRQIIETGSWVPRKGNYYIVCQNRKMEKPRERSANSAPIRSEVQTVPELGSKHYPKDFPFETKKPLAARFP
nr:hypothetical protein Iba_scaffold43401CG0030 [Ipomoea batatas]